jgi:ribosomal subunit interface protein
VEIVVKARHADVDKHFRACVQEKLERLAKLDAKVDRVDVAVSEERNPRLSDVRVRVELTCRSRGPVIRAEAAAADGLEALDLAVGKLDMRLRRAADRRRVHHGSRTPVSVAVATAAVANPDAVVASSAAATVEPVPPAPDDDRPFVVREKEHEATPMSLDQALFEMELVGHDFYLYVDEADGVPSVVYRRRGYDYGVLRLRTSSTG